MKGFWLSKFDELSIFNADNDKMKYTEAYMQKMAALQREYNDRLLAFAKTNGYLIA